MEKLESNQNLLLKSTEKDNNWHWNVGTVPSCKRKNVVWKCCGNHKTLNISLNVKDWIVFENGYLEMEEFIIQHLNPTIVWKCNITLV